MCARLAYEFPDSTILFEPRAIAHHFVPANRVTWHYFWTRSFLVNCDKVPAFAELGDAASLSAEVSVVIRTLRSHVISSVRGMLGRNATDVLQLGAATIGIILAGLGNLVGKIQLLTSTRAPARR